MSRVFIHKVVEGPFYSEDEDAYGIVVVSQDEGTDHLYQDVIYSQEEDALYEIYRYIAKGIDPWIVDMEDDVEERIGQN